MRQRGRNRCTPAGMGAPLLRSCLRRSQSVDVWCVAALPPCRQDPTGTLALPVTAARPAPHPSPALSPLARRVHSLTHRRSAALRPDAERSKGLPCFVIECRRAVCLRALFPAAAAVAPHDAQALDAPAHIRPEWREIAREAADSEHADEARLELDARILRAQEARERQLQVWLLQRRVTCCNAARLLGG